MRRAVLSLATLAALVLVFAQPVAAAPPIRESGTVEYAFGYTTQCEPQGAGSICTDTNINVYDSAEGSTVCVDVFTYSISSSGRFRFISQESGCEPLAPGAFTVSGDLSSATLSATTVQLYSCNRHGCTPGDLVTVTAEWQGTGELRTYSSRGSFTEGDCRYRYTQQGATRDASVLITIDGVTSMGEGGIGEDEYTFTSTCG